MSQVTQAKRRCVSVKRPGVVTILQDIRIGGRPEDSPLPESLPPTPTINLVTDEEDGGRTPAVTWQKPTEGEMTDEEDRPSVLDEQMFKAPAIRSSAPSQSGASRSQSPAPGPSGLCRPGTSRSRSPAPGPSGLCRPGTSRSRSPAPGPSGLCRAGKSRSRSPAPGPSGVSRPEISRALKMPSPPAAAPTPTLSLPASSRLHSSGGKNMTLLAALLKQSSDSKSPARSPASTQEDDGESSSDEQRRNVLAVLEEERGRREAWQRGVRSVMAKVRRRRERLTSRIAWMRRQLEEDALEVQECDAAFVAYEQLL